MAAKGKLPPKSLKIKTVPGLDTGPEEIKEKQRSDRTLKKYEEKCELAGNELAKEKTRNRKYYKKKTRKRKLKVGDSVLLLLPTEKNKLILAWQSSGCSR